MTIFGDKNHRKDAFNLRGELNFHTLLNADEELMLLFHNISF